MKSIILNLKEKRYRKKGQFLLSKGKTKKAFLYFQNALILNDSTENIFNFALSLMSLFKYKEAEVYLRKVYEKFPENEINSLALAECLLMQKKWKETEKIYQTLLEKNPDSTTYKKYQLLIQDVTLREKHVLAKESFNRAFNEINNKNLDQALVSLKKAEQFIPDDVNILNNIGSILLKTKKYLEAYKYFEKAITLAPKNKKIQKNFYLVKRKISQKHLNKLIKK